MIVIPSLCKSFGMLSRMFPLALRSGEILLILKARISTAMFPDILYFGIEFFKGNERFIGDLSGSFDIGVFGHEQRDDEVFVVCQVDQVLVVVEIDHC